MVFIKFMQLPVVCKSCNDLQAFHIVVLGCVDVAAFATSKY